MATSLWQAIFEAMMVMGVVGSIAIIYWAKFSKQTFSQVIKKIFSTKLFMEEPKEDKPVNPMEERQQIWQQNRTLI